MSDSVRPHRQKPTRLLCPWDSPGKNAAVGCHFLLQCMKVKSESEVTQSCPTLSDPMDCSLQGSSIHGISQARVLEWGAIAFSECEFGGGLLVKPPSIQGRSSGFFFIANFKNWLAAFQLYNFKKHTWPLCIFFFFTSKFKLLIVFTSLACCED